LGIVLDRLSRLIARGITLVYGPAGIGKTNLVLWLLSAVSVSGAEGKFLYISTEGSLYGAIVSKLEYPDNVYFAEALSSDHLLQLIFKALTDLGSELKLIIVDSINNFYRIDAPHDPNANRVLNTILALVAHMVYRYGLTCVLTAQVREVSSEELNASGYTILRFWSDSIIRLERGEDGTRVLVVESPADLFMKVHYIIGDGGIRWVES